MKLRDLIEETKATDQPLFEKQQVDVSAVVETFLIREINEMQRKLRPRNFRRTPRQVEKVIN